MKQFPQVSHPFLGAIRRYYYPAAYEMSRNEKQALISSEYSDRNNTRLSDREFVITL
jgi:hypothetical protein